MTGGPLCISTRRELAEKLRRIKTGQNAQPEPDLAKIVSNELLATGIMAFDRHLPQGGLRAGTLVEWLADGAATGADCFALSAARGLLNRDGSRSHVLAIIDHEKNFYPPAAVALGLAVRQMIVVRPDTFADALWALEQCLRSSGVRVALCRIPHAEELVLRRLQLAAERGGGLGFLLRPTSARGQPAWCDVRVLMTSLPSPEKDSRRLSLEFLRCRRGAIAGAVLLELDDETGCVSEISAGGRAESRPPGHERRSTG